jgi:hypothetical protein
MFSIGLARDPALLCLVKCSDPVAMEAHGEKKIQESSYLSLLFYGKWTAHLNLQPAAASTHLTHCPTCIICSLAREQASRVQPRIVPLQRRK